MVKKVNNMPCCVWANKLDVIRIHIMLYYLATSKEMNAEELTYNELKNVLNDLILERKTMDEIGKEWEEKAKSVKKEG